MAHEYRDDDFLFSDRPSLLDLDVAHGFIARSYWAKGIPRALFERSIANSMAFGIYHQTRGAGQMESGQAPRQVGFARVISDRATYAYLADVFVDEGWRGRGLAKKLVQHIINHPELQGIRRMALITSDAQTLYAQLGFVNMPDPRKYMEWRWKGSYTGSP